MIKSSGSVPSASLEFGNLREKIIKSRLPVIDNVKSFMKIWVEDMKGL